MPMGRGWFGAVCLLVALMAAALAPGVSRLAADSRPALRAVSMPGAVHLAWDPSDLPGVVGFLIRRGTEPGQEDRWPINDIPVPGMSFVDRYVQPGQTYYYMVIPLLADGKWGRASVEVSGAAAPVPKGYRWVELRLDSPDALLITSAGQQRVTLRGRPVLDRGRVLLVLEDLADLLEADLSHDPQTGQIRYVLPTGQVVQMEVGVCCLRFSKAIREDHCSPIEQDGLVYLPLRWIVETLLGQMHGDPLTRSVTVELMAGR